MELKLSIWFNPTQKNKQFHCYPVGSNQLIRAKTFQNSSPDVQETLGRRPSVCFSKITFKSYKIILRTGQGILSGGLILLEIFLQKFYKYAIYNVVELFLTNDHGTSTSLLRCCLLFKENLHWMHRIDFKPQNYLPLIHYNLMKIMDTLTFPSCCIQRFGAKPSLELCILSTFFFFLSVKSLKTYNMYCTNVWCVLNIKKERTHIKMSIEDDTVASKLRAFKTKEEKNHSRFIW